MALSIFFSVIVIFLSFHSSCQLYIENHLSNKHETETTTVEPIKSRTLYDYQTRVVAYKDLINSKCILEILNGGESRISKWMSTNGTKESISKSLSVTNQLLSKRQTWRLAGQRITEFCRGFPTYLIKDNSIESQNGEETYLNDLALGDVVSKRRRKRSTRHYFKGRVRGQTQSQYLSFGRSDQPGKAEAESTFDGSKAVVSGSSGMGQAQSQSLPIGCDDCYGSVPEQEQVIEFGGGGFGGESGTAISRPGFGAPEQLGQRPDQIGELGQVGPGGHGEVRPGEHGEVGPGGTGGPGKVFPGGPGELRPGNSMGSGPQGQTDRQSGPVGQTDQETGQVGPTRSEQPGGTIGVGPGGSGQVVPERPGQIGRVRPGQVTPEGPMQVGSPESEQVGPGRLGPVSPEGSTGLGDRRPISNGGSRQVLPGELGQVGPGNTEYTRPVGPTGTGYVEPNQIGFGGPGYINYGGPNQISPGGPGQITYGGPGQVSPGEHGQKISYGRPAEPSPRRPGDVPPAGTGDTGLVGPGKPIHHDGVFSGQLTGDYQSGADQRGRFFGKFSGQYGTDGFPYTGYGKPGPQTQQRLNSQDGAEGPSQQPALIQGQRPNYSPSYNGQSPIRGPHPPSSQSPGGPVNRFDESSLGPGYKPQETPEYGGGIYEDQRGHSNGYYGQNGYSQYSPSRTDHQNTGTGQRGQFYGQFSGQYETGPASSRVQYGPSVTSQYVPSATGQYGPGRTEQHGPETNQYGQDGTSQYRPDGTSQYRPDGTIQYTPDGRGQYGPGGTSQHGPDGTSQYGVGDTSQYGPSETGQYGPSRNNQYRPSGISQHEPSRTGQLGRGETGQYTPGRTGQLGRGETGQYTPGGTSQYGPGDTSQYGPSKIDQYRPGGTSQYRPADTGPYGPSGTGQYQPSGTDQLRPSETGQPRPSETGQQGPSGTGQQGPIGTGQQGPIGTGQQGPIGNGQQGPSGTGQYVPGTTSQYGQRGTNGQYLPSGANQYAPSGSGQQGLSGIGQYSPPATNQYGPSQYIDKRYPSTIPASNQQFTEGIQDTDDSDSQVQTSVQEGGNGTQAQAEAQGTYNGGTAHSQVSGTYLGSGSFSASAGSDDGKRGAQTQVAGGKDGAQSSAQGRGGLGQSQAQVVLSSETGNTLSSAQSSGFSHGTQSKVQASEKGGMANAQANAPGSTSSQAQIGFSPHDENEQDNQTTPFRGGGTAGAQSGSHSGISQAQIQGKFQYGIKYTGGAQAGSGGASLGRNQTFRPGPFKPVDLSSLSAKNEQSQILSQKNTSSPQKLNKAIPDSTIKPNEDEEDNDENKDYSDENKDYTDYYDEGTEVPSTKSIITQTSDNQRQHIILNPLENLDISVYQSKGDFPAEGTVLQPGEIIPGSPGHKIPLGFRGTVKSISNGRNTYAIGKNSQAQSVTISPGSGRIVYKRPVYEVASKTRFRNGKYSYGSGYTYQPAYQPVKYHLKNGKVLPNFVSVTKSEMGSTNVYTGKKSPSIYYSQSSSCGVFTNHCVFNGSKKICSPKLKTNPDGTLMGC